MIIIRTPFRVSFFGGGTDYPSFAAEHGGAVLSTSINKYAYITLRRLPPFFSHRSRVVWSQIELVGSNEEIQHPIVRACLEHMGISDGVEIHYDGDLPARSGLGSSSSFTVCLLHALNALVGRMASKRQLAEDAICIEQKMLREYVGSQDQVAAAFGGFNRIGFDRHGFTVTPVVLPHQLIDQLQRRLMFFYTGTARWASEVAQAQIQEADRHTEALLAMRQMVDDAIEMLSASDLDAFGKLLGEGWMLKRRLSSIVSNDEIDGIYQAAIDAGALGGKLCGAGSGGFMLFYVPPERQANVLAALRKLLAVPFRFEFLGSQVVHFNYEPEMLSESWEYAPPTRGEGWNSTFVTQVATA